MLATIRGGVEDEHGRFVRFGRSFLERGREVLRVIDEAFGRGEEPPAE